MVFSCKQPTEKVANSEKIEVDVDTNEEEFAQDEIFNVTPISHATMVMKWNDVTMYVDPVGGAERFENFDTPNVILVTDIHGDHLNVETLEAIANEETKLIVPQAVAEKLPENVKRQSMVLNNDESANVLGFTIKALPMYNLPETEDSRHPKGRGNGYVVENDEKRIYISGDTEDIDEMRALKNIDIAFVCMNLPYTMTVEDAADAVLEFAPTIVYPYHYRGQDGLSDVAKFKEIVNAGNSDINVTQLDWYPEKK